MYHVWSLLGELELERLCHPSCSRRGAHLPAQASWILRVKPSQLVGKLGAGMPDHWVRFLHEALAMDLSGPSYKMEQNDRLSVTMSTARLVTGSL